MEHAKTRKNKIINILIELIAFTQIRRNSAKKEIIKKSKKEEEKKRNITIIFFIGRVFAFLCVVLVLCICISESQSPITAYINTRSSVDVVHTSHEVKS